MTGLYIHVPFCVARCRYCDFYKEPLNENGGVSCFLDGLDVELSRLPESFVPDTVFIGGGTPTSLASNQLSQIFSTIRRRIDLSRVVEFSCEANPGTLTPEKLEVMKAGGISRVSIGVQSFDSAAIKLLGRIHSAEEAIGAFHMVRTAGFDNVNVDLIQSVPGMSPGDVLEDAHRIVELSPEHISYYNLIFEPGTPITKDRDEGRIVLPDEDEEADNYYAVKAFLEKAGYGHYEISNFSRPGRECLHNVLYWQGGEYFGCGPAAHSHWNGRRFGNVTDLAVWSERVKDGKRPFDEVEELLAEDKARETLVMWLRMTGGVDLARFRSEWGFDAEVLCGAGIRSMMEEGMLQKRDGRLFLSAHALFVCNAVFSELL